MSSNDPGASRGLLQRVRARGQAVWERAQRLTPMRAFSRFTNVGGSVLSGGMSYQALFAVFAALLVGFSVFGIVLRGNPEVLATLVEQINLFVPGLVGTAGSEGAVDLDDLLETQAFDWTSAIAGASLLWVALTWFTGTRRSIRIIFGLEVKQYRNPVLLKLRDFTLAVGFLAALVMSAALTVLSSNIVDGLFDWLGGDPDTWILSWVGRIARYGALLVFDVLLLLGIHYFLAEVRPPRGILLRGCLVGGIAMGVLKVLGTALLGSASSNPLLATFVVIIALLVWFNLICRTLLLTSCWIAARADRTLGLPEQLSV